MKYIESVTMHPKLQALVDEIKDGEERGVGFSEKEYWEAVVKWYQEPTRMSGDEVEALRYLGEELAYFTSWKGGIFYRGITLPVSEIVGFLGGYGSIKSIRDYESWSRSQHVSERFSDSGVHEFGIVLKKSISPNDILIDFTNPLTRSWIERMKSMDPVTFRGKYKGADKEIVVSAKGKSYSLKDTTYFSITRYDLGNSLVYERILQMAGRDAEKIRDEYYDATKWAIFHFGVGQNRIKLVKVEG